MAEEAPPEVPQAEWEALQRKIFTRWVNQKLASQRLPQIKDVVTDLGVGDTLQNLIQVLSERELPGKPAKKPMGTIVKAQQLEAVNNVLRFIWECGVDMKLKPSAENILKGDRRDIMALIWAMMMKFMKFDDDEDSQESLQAKDALLKWLQFHTSGYRSVQVVNLTKSFHNGLAFIGLIHKFKPSLVPSPDTLDPSQAAANLKMAMEAAEKFFGLEQYLEPKDVPKLDEKSALVYVSEYYYGINQAAKRVLAAKRISKLIAFTTVNDQLREKYGKDAQALLQHLARAETLLQDVSVVDNTLAGARKRVDDFNLYKTTEKGPITSLEIELEETFNTLSLRLKQNSRPAFAPADAATRLDALRARIKTLFAKETVEPALHAELNRQLRLVELNKRHQSIADKLSGFIKDKDAYVRARVAVASSGEARKQLKLFEAFVKERATMMANSFASLKDMGATLAREKFEHVAEVQKREAALADGFHLLEQQGKLKEPVLQDDLVRELLKEKVRLWVRVHKDIDAKLNKWAGEKQAYLEAIETHKVGSVQDAQLQLGLLQAYVREKADMSEGDVRRLQALGDDIRKAKHDTAHSQWVYEDPAAISGLENAVQARWEQLRVLSDAKQLVLDDALLREQFKEKVALWVARHQKMAEALQHWSQDRLAYLQVKESVASSAEAKNHLSLLEAFEKEKAETMEAGLNGLRSLGNDIRGARYHTQYSQWAYEKPQQVSALEAQLDKAWADLAAASSKKKAVLEDDLHRTLYAEHTCLLAGQHADKFEACKSWAAEKSAFLQSPTPVSSIDDAQAHLSLLEGYATEKESFTSAGVASLKVLGREILARKYHTALSSYSYESQQDISAREATIDRQWAELDSLYKARKQTLDAALAREVRKEDLRLEFADHAGDFARFVNETLLAVGSVEEQKILCGSTLEEVVAYGKQIAGEDAGAQAALQAKKGAYGKVAAELASLACSDNPYTDLDVPALDGLGARLLAALAGRRATQEAEHQEQLRNDELCKAFAAAVVPLARAVEQQTAEVLDTAAQPEAQLALVNQRLGTVDGDFGGLAAAKQLEQQIHERKITINVYTTLRVSELEMGVALLKQILTRKKPYLEKVIEYTRYKGISPEQYAEMEAMFKQYDKDKSGSINARELRTCLYSLGEERSKAEIAKYMAELGRNGVLTFEPFRELMVRLLGDAGNEAAMLESFYAVSRGAPVVSKEILADLLSAEEVRFILATAPGRDGGYDFEKWVAEVCAR